MIRLGFWTGPTFFISEWSLEFLEKDFCTVFMGFLFFVDLNLGFGSTQAVGVSFSLTMISGGGSKSDEMVVQTLESTFLCNVVLIQQV
jgi:hypothetical protein